MSFQVIILRDFASLTFVIPTVVPTVANIVSTIIVIASPDKVIPFEFFNLFMY